MEIWGYFASALIGISLGLIGGGGSILTVPVMVYLFGLPPMTATSYSLFIVGAASLAGAISNYRRGCVNTRAALYFGITSVITVFITRRFIIPAIPKNIVTIRGFTVTEPLLTMVLFGVLMLPASVNMIKEKQHEVPETTNCPDCFKFAKLLGYGVVIGLITGLLGAGGGFLLIPALVLLIRLPMKKAVGTSLLIIALNSLTGFTGDIGHFKIDWWFLTKISLIAISGIFIGGMLGRKISAEKLKKGFGWFVLFMGIYIIIREIFTGS
jgi:uncharacterized membrane protein YfcA